MCYTQGISYKKGMKRCDGSLLCSTVNVANMSKYKGGVFKVPMLHAWIVVVTGQRLIEEIQRYPEEQLSMREGAGEVSLILSPIFFH